MRVPPPIPDGVARTTIALRGAAGRDWFDRLPARIVACGERWSLEVGPPFSEPSFNYAAPTLRADGTAAVLRLSFPEDSGFYREFYREAEALRVFDGRGAVRLLEVDKGRGAMLLERLEPGVPPTTVRDDEEATSIGRGRAETAMTAGIAGSPFPGALRLSAGFRAPKAERRGRDEPHPAAFVEGAEDLFAELLASQDERLCCTATYRPLPPQRPGGEARTVARARPEECRGRVSLRHGGAAAEPRGGVGSAPHR